MVLTMRLLEALKILEAATIDCKTRDIDTPEAREALDALASYCQPGFVMAIMSGLTIPSPRKRACS